MRPAAMALPGLSAAVALRKLPAALVLPGLRPASALAALLALLAAPAQALEAGEHLDLSVSLRADAWSGSRRLDDDGPIGRGSAWSRAKLDLGDAGGLVADGWLGARTGGDAGQRAGRMRELYWRGNQGRVDWKIGRQTIVWGRADGLNPTDNLAPRDFTLLVPEDNEQRRGNDGLQIGVDTGLGTLSGIWFVRAASHTLPLEPLAQASYAVAAPPHRPQWALKLDMTGEGIDGSVSYFDGTDPVPDLSVGGIGPAGLLVAARNNPLRVLGADVSLARDGVIWRAEAAWMQTASKGPDDFQRKKPRLWLVAGAEWTLPGNTTLGLQASLQHVVDFRSPDAVAAPVEREVAWRQASIANQTSATQVGAIWRLASRWRNDTVLAETSGVVMSSPSSGLWRTRFTYAVNDRVQLLAGTDLYFGPQHSLWGQLRKNRLVYAQVRYAL